MPPEPTHPDPNPMFRSPLLPLLGLVGLAALSGGPAAAAPQETPAAAAEAPAPEAPVYIVAERVIVRPGKELENATVVVGNGRILAVEEGLEAPEGARVLRGKVVCAGFLDPWSTLGLDPGSVAQGDSNMVTMAEDALDPFSQGVYLEHALRAGVTSVGTAVGRSAGERGIGAVVRTLPGHARPGHAVLSDAFAAIRLGIDGDLFDRVGQVERLVKNLEQGRDYRLDEVEYRYELEAWEAKIAKEQAELEEDFKKAKKDRDKDLEKAREDGKEFKEKSYKEDKRPRAPRFDAEKAVWARIAEGELPLVVEAHRYAELRALLDGTKGFARLRMILAGGTESAAFASALAARSIPVIVWPAPAGSERPDHLRNHDLATAGVLAEEGVTVLLGSGGTDQARDLPLLASLAIGHGLEPEHALAALTTEAAKALDVGDRLGQVRRGYHADLLVLDGDPLSSNTRVLQAVVAGQVAYDAEANQ